MFVNAEDFLLVRRDLLELLLWRSCRRNRIQRAYEVSVQDKLLRRGGPMITRTGACCQLVKRHGSLPSQNLDKFQTIIRLHQPLRPISWMTTPLMAKTGHERTLMTMSHRPQPTLPYVQASFKWEGGAVELVREGKACFKLHQNMFLHRSLGKV